MPPFTEVYENSVFIETRLLATEQNNNISCHLNPTTPGKKKQTKQKSTWILEHVAVRLSALTFVFR